MPTLIVSFVSEYDVLQALAAGKNLRALTAQDLMASKPVTVTGATTLAEAARILLETGFTVLPVERHGVVTYSLTRHDLLRAWLGLGLGGEG